MTMATPVQHACNTPSFEYDEFADVLEISLADRPSVRVEDAPQGVVVYFDANNEPVGLEVLAFCRRVDQLKLPGILSISTSTPFAVDIPKDVVAWCR